MPDPCAGSCTLRGAGAETIYLLLLTAIKSCGRVGDT
jgi:hypothetical protein